MQAMRTTIAGSDLCVATELHAGNSRSEQAPLSAPSSLRQPSLSLERPPLPLSWIKFELLCDEFWGFAL